MFLITFVELRVVAGRNRTRTGRPHAVSGRPMLIHTFNAMHMPRCAVGLRSRFQNGLVVAWHGRGIACVLQTRPHRGNQMGKTDSKTLKADSHIPCRSHAVPMPFPCRFKDRFSHTMPFPCRDPATTLPFSDSAVSVKVPYLVHAVLLLSPSRKYILLNCYHNLCAINYTSTHVLAPK
jgi:hypothetical protein